MLCNLSYWVPELHGSVATWPSGCQVLYEPSCLDLLRLGYVAPACVPSRYHQSLRV